MLLYSILVVGSCFKSVMALNTQSELKISLPISFCNGQTDEWMTFFFLQLFGIIFIVLDDCKKMMTRR